MVRRQGSGIIARLTSLTILCLLAVACSTAGGGPTTTAEPPPPSTTAPTPPTTSTTTTSTTIPDTTTSVDPPTTSTTVTLPDIDAEVSVPEGDGPFPAVVLVHGGSWVAGDPGLMRSLAGHLRDGGFLTVNTRYQLAGEFPAARGMDSQC